MQKIYRLYKKVSYLLQLFSNRPYHWSQLRRRLITFRSNSDIRFSGTPRIEVSRFLAESNPKHHVLSLTFLQVELVAFDHSRWLGVRCGMEVQTVEVQIIIKYICLPIYLRLAFVQSLFRKEKLNCRANPPQSFYEIQAIGEESSYWF